MIPAEPPMEPGIEMDAPTPADDPVFRLFLILLCAVSLVTVAGGFAWRGLDFAASALLGSLIVGLNLIWTRKAVRKALAEEQPKPHFFVSYLLKFTVSVIVLFVAIMEFRMDPLGILAGVSTLLITSLIVGLARHSL